MSKTGVADFSNSVPKVLVEVTASVIRVEGSFKCKNWNIMCKGEGVCTEPHPVWTDGHFKGGFLMKKNKLEKKHKRKQHG
jgi:hypothetical protein